MFHVDMNFIDQFSSTKPFQIKIKVVVTDKRFESYLVSLFKEKTFFIRAYYNPILWMFCLSPIFVYIDTNSSGITLDRPLMTNKEILLKFEKRWMRKYFKESALKALSKFLDSQAKNYWKEGNNGAGI